MYVAVAGIKQALSYLYQDYNTTEIKVIIVVKSNIRLIRSFLRFEYVLFVIL